MFTEPGFNIQSNKGEMENIFITHVGHDSICEKDNNKLERRGRDG